MDDVGRDPAWETAPTLAQHRLYYYWNEPRVFPCDGMGYRMPRSRAALVDRYRAISGTSRVFCFGGSTTFGWLCTYEESYPHLLEQALGGTAAVFNCGLAGASLLDEVHAFIDLLRLGIVPDLCIFYDGINEKQGFLQAHAGATDYVERTNFYDVAQQKGTRRGRSMLASLRARRASRARPASDTLRFAKDQAAAYLRSARCIDRLAKAYGVAVRFFLQPCLWDAMDDSTTLGVDAAARFAYVRAVYASILEGGTDLSIVDFRRTSRLRPAMFHDWQHCTPDGNSRIAAALREELNRK